MKNSELLSFCRQENWNIVCLYVKKRKKRNNYQVEWTIQNYYLSADKTTERIYVSAYKKTKKKKKA